MRQGSFLIVSLLTGITFLACECLSLSTTHGYDPPCASTAGARRHDRDNQSTPANHQWMNRRSILQGVAPTFLWLVSAPPEAQALQARNEILCGTGFFTNIALYKCTEIGDISQDGKVQSLTSSEEGSIQSLLDKLGVDDTTTSTTMVTEGDTTEENNKDEAASKLDKS